MRKFCVLCMLDCLCCVVCVRSLLIPCARVSLCAWGIVCLFLYCACACGHCMLRCVYVLFVVVVACVFACVCDSVSDYVCFIFVGPMYVFVVSVFFVCARMCVCVCVFLRVSL